MMADDTTLIAPEDAMGRPPKADKLGDPLGVRFTEDQLSDLDKLLSDKFFKWPDVGVHNRNDLIRRLVVEGIERHRQTKRSR